MFEMFVDLILPISQFFVDESCRSYFYCTDAAGEGSEGCAFECPGHSYTTTKTFYRHFLLDRKIEIFFHLFFLKTRWPSPGGGIGDLDLC